MNILLKIIKRELIRIEEKKTLHLMLIIFPTIIFTLYGLIYKKEIIREIPTAIYDEDNSPLSQKIIQQIESSSSLKIIKYDFSINEIKNDFIDDKIHCAFYIPRNLEKNIKEGKNSTVIIYKNSSNLILSNIILKDATSIIKTVSGSILLKKIRSRGSSFSKSISIVNPIQIETAVLYNPNYSYSNYLVPGLIGFTFQLLIMIASVIVFASEFTHNTFEELLKISKSNILTIILGKLIPHFILNFSSILLILYIIYPVFDIKIFSSSWKLILLYSIFVFACITIAFAISSIIHDQQFATEIAVFYNTPSFIFSGFTFPLWAMPNIHSAFAQLMPFTHFVSASIKLIYLNDDFVLVKNEIISLFLFVIVSLITIFCSLSIQKNKLKEQLKY